MRFRPVLLLSVAIVAVPFGLLPVRGAVVPDQSETKIRLLTDALTARDHGDYATAKGKLEALQAIAPNDPTVRRILVEINTRLAAPPTPPVPPPSPPVRVEPAPPPVEPVRVAPPPPPEPAPRSSTPAVPGQVVMPVVHDEKADTPNPGPQDKLSPEARAAATAAEALLHANDTQLGKVMGYVEAQQALARTQARDKDFAAAIATLTAALEELQRPVEELREERREYARQKREVERAEERARTGMRMRHRR